MVDPRFHKISSTQSLSALSDIVGAELLGDGAIEIQNVASLNQAGDKEITFFDNVKYKKDFQNTKASACIIAPAMVESAPEGCALLVSKNPYKAYALIAQIFYPEITPPTNISDKASVAKTAKIGEGCHIEPHAVIGENVELGENCWIEAGAVIRSNVQIGKNSRIGSNASVSHAIIGEGVRLYPGVCIGQDGFGFAIDPQGHVKVPQLGRVIIEDHVEIGSNSCVDRGAGPDTIIGAGTWIDNCVQIAHNVRIGKGCVIVAQAGIAGSTVLADYVVVAAQSGVAGHLTIGTGTRIGAQSGVMSNLDAGSEVLGAPAVPIKQFMRQVVALKKLTNPKKK